MSSIEEGNEAQTLPTPSKVIKSKPRSKEHKQDFYNKKILKEDAKIEDIPDLFRTTDLYILALSNVKNLSEKRHIVKVMMQDAKEYRESGMENKAIVLENLRGLVFGKVTTQEELPHICHEEPAKEIKLSPFKLMAAASVVCVITDMVRNQLK